MKSYHQYQGGRYRGGEEIFSCQNLLVHSTSLQQCIWICVSHEPSQKSNDEHKTDFPLKECLELLLKNDIDPDIPDSTGDTLLIYAIKNHKKTSI